MLEGLGQLAGLFKQAQQLQKQLQQMQQALANQRFEAEAGGGMVTATVNGKGELLSLRLARQAVNPDEVELLEELIQSAVAAATRKARQHAQAEMAKLTGGIDLGALGQLLGPGG
ncbi:MAG: YbaB/EbfC family nucleoid-associated protein [Phycisphaerae bacterium]